MKNWSMREQLFRQRRLRILLLFLIILAFLLGLAVVPIERAVGQITTPFDGVWWAVSTVTTVGYGDYVPVTVQGRLIGIVLQVVGAMIFGIVVAMASNLMSRSQDEFYWNRLFERLDRIEKELTEIQKRTGFIVRDKIDPPQKT